MIHQDFLESGDRFREVAHSLVDVPDEEATEPIIGLHVLGVLEGLERSRMSPCLSVCLTQPYPRQVVLWLCPQGNLEGLDGRGEVSTVLRQEILVV